MTHAIGLHRPKPVHVRIVEGQVVETTYEVMPAVHTYHHKSYGSGVVYSPAPAMTTRSFRWKRLQINRAQRESQGTRADFVPGTRLIQAAR